MNKKWQRWIFLMIITSLFIGSCATGVRAEEDPDKWIVIMNPSPWVPAIDSDLRFTTPSGSTGSPTVSMDSNDLLEDLDFGFASFAEVRKGRWLLGFDTVYLKLSSSESKVKEIDFGGSLVSTNLDIGTEVELQYFHETFVGGYNVINSETLRTDVIAGVRYAWAKVDIDWNLSADVNGPLGGQTFSRTGSASQDGDLWNGVGGFKGQINLGQSHWYIPYYADVGAGDSVLTWQVASGLAYAFRSWDIQAGYRHLVFDQDDDSLITNLTSSGPTVGATFRF